MVYMYQSNYTRIEYNSERTGELIKYKLLKMNGGEQLSITPQYFIKIGIWNFSFHIFISLAKISQVL